ncbi:MAG: hypothetical protein E7312_00660 [Clostridiales bacterium]|nr:hypothetical protein [Clostridiales bacterium]
MANKFPFGAWVYHPINEIAVDEVDLWADMGLTCTMAPSISMHNEAEIEKLSQFLDKAASRDIKLILNVSGIGRSGDYEKDFTEIYNRFKGHPALFGFVIGDEPATKQLADHFIKIMSIQKKVAPELNPYINLAGSSPTIPALLDGKTYSEWLADFKERSSCDLVCFDEYCQTINDGGVTLYYKTLKAQSDAALASGMDLWVTLLSSAHYAYRPCTEFQFTWQITMSAAFGCKGVIWFRLYDREISPNYHASPLDEYHEPTPTYHMLRRCHKRFNDQFGEILPTLKRKKSYIIGFQRGDWPVFSDDIHYCIKAVRSFEDAVISFFEDDDGNDYVCFVNAEMAQIGHYKFVVDNNYKLTELICNGTIQQPADFAEHDGILLNPGQMVLYRIDKK